MGRSSGTAARRRTGGRVDAVFERHGIDSRATDTGTQQERQAFEADLQRRVHLENTILSPKALALERQMRGAA